METGRFCPGQDQVEPEGASVGTIVKSPFRRYHGMCPVCVRLLLVMKPPPAFGRQNKMNKPWGFDLRSISHAVYFAFGKKRLM